MAINNKIQNENRFPDNYKPVPQEQIYLEASHSVIPGATVETQPQPEKRHPDDPKPAPDTAENKQHHCKYLILIV